MGVIMSEKFDFIKQDYLDGIIEENRIPKREEVISVLEKGKEKKGLSIEETFILLQANDAESIEEIYETARKIKDDIYGNRMVVFAPLYITNECSNICDYCGFRADNKELHRRTLTMDELKEDTGRGKIPVSIDISYSYKYNYKEKSISSLIFMSTREGRMPFHIEIEYEGIFKLNKQVIPTGLLLLWCALFTRHFRTGLV